MNEELKFCENSKKKFGGGGVGVEGSVGGVGLGWGVRLDVNEIEVFVKIQKKNFWGGGVRGGGVGGWGRGQAGCERRIEVFVKIQKKNYFFLGGGGGGGGVGVGLGVRVDVNEELKFL